MASAKITNIDKFQEIKKDSELRAKEAADYMYLNRDKTGKNRLFR